MNRFNLLKNVVCGMLVAGAIGTVGTTSAFAQRIPHRQWTNQQLSTNNRILRRYGREWKQARDEFKERHAPNRGGPQPRPEYHRERNQLIQQRNGILNRLRPIQQELRRRGMPLDSRLRPRTNAPAAARRAAAPSQGRSQEAIMRDLQSRSRSRPMVPRL